MAFPNVTRVQESSTWLVGIALKAAVATLPLSVGVFFAPAEAAITKAFTNFTDVFAPSNWSPTKEGDGVGSLTETVMTLTAGDSTPAGSYQYSFNTNLLNSSPPPSPSSLPLEFVSGTYSFDWTWSFANGPATKPTLGLIYPFVTFDGVNRSEPLWTFNGVDASSATSYITAGNATASVSQGNPFGFALSSTITGDFFQDSIATITNFQFTATYVEVPGPLPIAGAAAGFAWSRRIRRRLKAVASSRTVA
jgi:hypothetical protein